MSRFTFINKYLKPYRVRFCLIIITAVCYAVLALLASLVFSFIIDNIIQGLPIDNPFLQFLNHLLGGQEYIRDHLWIIALALIAIYAIHALLMYYRYDGQAVISEGMVKGIREDLYNHIQLMPFANQVRAKTGDLIQRCTSDVETVRRFFAGQCVEIIVIVASALSALLILYSINVSLAIVASISFPLIFVYSYVFFSKIQKQFLASDEMEAVMTSKIQEALSGVRVVKAFHREKYELDKFLDISGQYKNVTYKMIESLGWYWGMSYLICNLGILSVILFGIFAVQDGSLTVGNFTVFITYQSTVLFQLRQLGRILSDFGRLMVAIDRLKEIKEEPVEDLESGEKPDLDGDIIFNNVSFHYADDPNTEILKNISLTIKKGKTLAIIGPTGSGKSSLVQLLDRLYEPSSGFITINGHNINTVAKGYLRRNIGIVLQEPFLFSKTIYDNLKIADPTLEFAAVEKATRIADVHDVITTFDQGYDTLVGEKGVTLSGGQKQRIAIARTLVNNSKILVFDDSLSAVDTETDAHIRHALKSLKGDATMIIITQRVLTAMDADMIVVIEDGVITEKGNHQELINNNGLYSRINAIQNAVKKETVNEY